MRTIFSDMKNKSVKLPFVTKNSKHLVGTGADDLSALIEFTPLWKTKVSGYHYLGTFAYKNKTIATSKYFVNVKTRRDDSWPLFEFTRCEKQKYHVTLCNLKKISLPICLLLTHELLQNAKLTSFITSHHYTETTQCILCYCHNPLHWTGLKITNRQHTLQSLLFNHQSPCT